MISNLAYVHPDAKIGNNVTVEPFAYIAGDVVIGDDCWIGPGAVIHDGARIGRGCRIHTAASVSCLPQDLKFAGEVTTAEIGDYNDIREYVTISRGTASTGTTRIGSHNLLMAYVHIAHDCYRSPVQSVPCIMEIPQDLRCDPVDILFGSKRYPFTVTPDAYLQAIEFIAYVISAEFLLYHALLLFHFCRIQGDCCQPVLDDEHGLVNVFRIV